MKAKLIFTILILLLLSTLFCIYTLAEDYTQLNLPKGAKARIGKGVILDIQISPNNTRLAVASSIGIWLYDISTDKQLAPIIKFETMSVSKIAFSPDSTKLAVSSPDLPIQIWNVKNGEQVISYPTSKGALRLLEFTKNGNTLVSLYETGDITIWDTINGIELDSFSTIKPRMSIKGNRLVRGFTVYVDDNTVTVATRNKDGSISIKDEKSGIQITKLTSNYDMELSLPIYYDEEDTLVKHPKSDKYPMKWVSDINFSKDGNTLFYISNPIKAKWGSVGGAIGYTEVWDVKTGQQLASLKTHVSIQASSNSKTIALIGHKSCEIWDIKTKRKITEFPNIEIIRFSGDGKTYAIIGKDFYALWDIASHSEIMLNRQIIEWEEDPPEDYFLSYDGTLLATIGENGTIALWEQETLSESVPL